MNANRHTHLHESIQHIVGDFLGDHAIVFVQRVVGDELTHPHGSGEDLAGGALVDEVEVLVDLLPRALRAVNLLKVRADQRDEPREVLLSLIPRLLAHIPIQNLRQRILAATLLAALTTLTTLATGSEGPDALEPAEAAVGEPELLPA